jgi:hypothetical protein
MAVGGRLIYCHVGANYLFPEDWEPYEAAIPESERHDYIAAYGKRLRGELGDKAKLDAAKAWSVWEGRTSKLVQDPPEIINTRFGEDNFALAFARIENHYFTNKGNQRIEFIAILYIMTDNMLMSSLTRRLVDSFLSSGRLPHREEQYRSHPTHTHSSGPGEI